MLNLCILIMWTLFFPFFKLYHFSYFLIFIYISLILCATCFLLIAHSIYAIFTIMFIFLLISCLLLLVNIDFLAFVYIIVYVGAISVFFLFAVMLLDLKTDEILEQKKNTILKYLFCFFIIDDLFTLKYMQFSFFNNTYIKQHLAKTYERIYAKYMKLDIDINQDSAKNISEITSHILDQHQYLIIRQIVDYSLQNMYLNRIEHSIIEHSLQRKDHTDIIVMGQLLFTEYGMITYLLGILLLLALIGIILLTFEYSKTFIKRQFLYQQLKRSIHNSIIISSFRQS